MLNLTSSMRFSCPSPKESVLLLLLLFCLLRTSCCVAKKSWADIVVNKPQADEKVAGRQIEPVAPPSPSLVTKVPTQSHGVYHKPPPSAQLFRVHHVYDGDTLTLMDGRRVRFFGIDTPELKPIEQAFSQEAKAYTQQYCRKRKEIYLDIMSNGDGDDGSEGKVTDKYGRLLAIVWAKTENGNYQNVCEGLVAAGLATVYFTKENGSSISSPKNKHHQQYIKKKLLQIQTEARKNRVGLWKDFTDQNVVVTRYGTAYHLSTCHHLARSRNTRVVRASRALDQGLHPCRSCLADTL